MDSVKFNLGEIVYLKVKSESEGMITGILFSPAGVRYYVTWDSGEEKSHYDIELTKEKIFENK